MREDVGLELRQEFEEGVEAVEAQIRPPAPRFPADVMTKFQITEAQLKDLAERHATLKIAGANDKQGYAVAHAARMEIRDARIRIEKTRKSLNEDAQEWIKTCNGAAKHLIAIIAPTEAHLDAEEDAYNAEVEHIKAEKQAEAAAKLQKRIEELQAVGHPVNVADLTLMTDAQYGFVYAAAKEAWEVKEKARMEAEEKARAYEAQQAKEAAERAEKERQEREAREAAEAAERARIRAEQEAEAKRIAEEREAVRKEREALEAEKRKAEQAAREEQIRKDAEAKAKADAERAERERIEAQEREAKRRAEIEAAKPDAEKIRALAKVFREVGLPKMATDAGRAAMAEIETNVAKFAAFVESRADKIAPSTLKAP